MTNLFSQANGFWVIVLLQVGEQRVEGPEHHFKGLVEREPPHAMHLSHFQFWALKYALYVHKSSHTRWGLLEIIKQFTDGVMELCHGRNGLSGLLVHKASRCATQ